MNYNSKLKEWRKLKKFSTKKKAYYAKMLRFFGYKVSDIAKKLDLTQARVYQYLKK